MIELTKTRRLTIATVVFVLIILVGLVTLRKPDYKYTITAQEMLTEVNAPENLVTLDDLNNGEMVLVDLRQTYDFSKGTIDHALNIPVSDILDKDVISMLDEWQNNSKTIVLFSNDLQGATAPWMLLRQMGYSNIKVLEGGYCQFKSVQSGNQLASDAYKPEQPDLDYAKFIEDASGKDNSVTKNEPTQIIPIIRTKKSATAGGC